LNLEQFLIEVKLSIAIYSVIYKLKGFKDYTFTIRILFFLSLITCFAEGATVVTAGVWREKD